MSKQNIFKRVLQILFSISLFSPLLVDKYLFFPYVTSSTLFFRLVVQILFLAWLIFILVYPKERPKMNILLGSFGVYILVLTASALFGSSPFLSFWGDIERMTGVFGLLYIFALFLVGSSIFGSKKELKFLLNVFLVASTAVAVYGLLQKLGLTGIEGEERIFAMLGNAAKLAAYLIFGLFFTAYLCLKNSKWSWRLIYGSVFLIHGLAVFLTGTRGAFLGLAAGFVFAVIVLVKNAQNKKLRIGLASGFLFLLVSYGLLFTFQNQDWIKNNAYLYRLVHFSLADSTIQGRLIAWKAGWLGFLDKPLPGYGYENFSEPFNKHFDARYYSFAAEEYFDRAHNIVIEHLAATGILGLLSYLAFLFCFFYCVVKVYKKDKDFVFLAGFGGLAIAYFIQNLFLFDSLPALLGLAILLVFVSKSRADLAEEANPQEEPILKIRPAVVALAAIVLAAGLYYSTSAFVVKPYRAFRDSVKAQILLFQPYQEQEQAYRAGMAYLRRSVSYNTFWDLDLKTVAANTIHNYYTAVAQGPNQKFDLDFAIELHKQNLMLVPADTYYKYKLAELLDVRYVTDLDVRFRDEAKIYIDEAITGSPQRVTLYYILMENLMFAGKFDESEATIRKAIALNDKIPASYWELAKILFQKQDFENAKEAFSKAINMGHHVGQENIDRFMPLFNVQVSRENEIEFLELVAKNGTTDYLVYSTLANLYYQKGEYEKAIEYAQKSAELNPSTKETVDKFIETLRKRMGQ